MLDAVLRTLGGAVNGMDEAINGRRKQQQAQDQDAEINKHFLAEANKAADTGDWQYFYAQEHELTRRIPGPLLDSLVTKTKLNNARLFDQQMAAGEQPTIPLSPGNMAQRGRPVQYPMMGGPSVPVNPLQAVMQTQMDPGAEPDQPYNGEVGGFAQPDMGVQSSKPGIPPTPPPLLNAAQFNGGVPDQPTDMSTAIQPAVPAQPIAQAEPVPQQTPVAPTKPAQPITPVQQDFTFPPDRQAKNSSSVVHTPIGPRTLSRSQTALTGPEVTGSLLSQADEMGKTPDEAFAYFNKENNKRLQDGKPTFEWDHQQMNAANARQWDKTRAGIQDYLESQLNYPREVAQRESAIMASRKLQFTPSQYTSLVNPSESDVANGAFNNAVKTASIQIDSMLEGMQAPLKSTRPSVLLNDVFTKPFLKQAIDSVPGANLQPAARTAALHTLANTAHSAFFTAIQQARPDLTRFQQNYFAMSMASKAVGGDVPEQWRAFVEQDPVKLGLLSSDNLPYYQSMPEKLRPDLLDPDAGQRVQNYRTDLERTQDRAKQYEQAMRGVIKTPEGQTAFNQMLTNQSNGQAAGSSKGKAITPATIGEQDRFIALRQSKAEKTQGEQIKKDFSQADTTEMKSIKQRDDIYKLAVQSQQAFGAKDEAGRSVLERYAATPAFARETVQSLLNKIGSGDPQLNQLTSVLGELQNIKRLEFAGTAASVNEMKELVKFVPSMDDNLTLAATKLNEFTKRLRGTMTRDIDLIGKNTPGTDLSGLHYHKIEAARVRQREKAKKKE